MHQFIAWSIKFGEKNKTYIQTLYNISLTHLSAKAFENTKKLNQNTEIDGTGRQRRWNSHLVYRSCDHCHLVYRYT